MSTNPKQNQGPTGAESNDQSLLKKEVTPAQYTWAVRLMVIGVLAIGGIQKTYEYIADSKAKAEVAQIIDYLDNKKGKDGGKEDCFQEELTGDYFCGKRGREAYNQIPKDRRDEKPIKVSRCNKTFKVRPFCLEQFDEVNNAMIAGTNGEACVEVNSSYRSTLDQWRVYKSKLDTEAEPPETPETAIAKIREGVAGSVKLTGIVGVPAAGPWHGKCAFDVQNWATASKYFHQKGFQGGIKMTTSGPLCGINKDLRHFSKGEMVMQSCVAQKLKQASKWFGKLFD